LTAPDDDEALRRMIAVLDAETDSIDQLARIAGLDRATALRGADLRGIVFDEGDDLAGFRLRNADLRGADLRRARGVTAAVLAGAIVDGTTRLGGGGARFPPLDPLLRWREPIPGLPEAAWPDMVTLPAGRFTMGAPVEEEGSNAKERPQREVTVPRPFALGRVAVTFAQWDAALAAGFEPGFREKPPTDNGWGRDARPVIFTTWEHTLRYCNWLNQHLGLPGGTYRLPSETEWEYACRAGTVTPFSFGATISPKQVNYNGNLTYGKGRKGEHRARTVPVGSLPANAWGLHEMHGNVREWCEDGFDDYRGNATDTRPVLSTDFPLFVLRGGSWLSNPKLCRSASRDVGVSFTQDHDVGFRLARTLF